MSRQLLVLRHAKSAWDTDAPTDFERPLAKRGRKDAPRVGAWLRREGLVPDHVVSSPAERARQTILRVCEELGVDSDRIAWDPRVYGAGVDGLLSVLADCPQQAKTILLVGHNPGLETLVEYLGGEDVEIPEDGKLLPTAAVASLKMPESWADLAEGSARLVSLTRPRSLDPRNGS